jgi:RNA polymerase sigma-70 factor (ECF subfamily)
MGQPEEPDSRSPLRADRKEWPSFEVVRAAKTGSEEGWQALADYSWPLIASRARDHGLHGFDVEDVAQEVYVEVVRNLEKFRHVGPGTFRAWLATIVEYKVADHFRRRSRQPGIETNAAVALEEIPSPCNLDETGLEADQSQHARRNRAAIQEVRARVSPRTWEAFSRVVCGDTVADVARDLDLSANAVRQACYRVHALLEIALESR